MFAQMGTNLAIELIVGTNLEIDQGQMIIGGDQINLMAEHKRCQIDIDPRAIGQVQEAQDIVAVMQEPVMEIGLEEIDQE